jgi:hypothetical protein
VRRHELVDLALRDTQELCDIRDDERTSLPAEAIRETARALSDILSRELFR